MQETWVWKGGCDGTGLKEKQKGNNKLKKGRKKKEDRTDSKKREWSL